MHIHVCDSLQIDKREREQEPLTEDHGQARVVLAIGEKPDATPAQTDGT